MHQVLIVALEVLLVILKKVFLVSGIDCEKGIEYAAVVRALDACIAGAWSSIPVGSCERRLVHGR